MKIALPNLAADHCLRFTICATVSRNKKAHTDWCKESGGWQDYLLHFRNHQLIGRIGLTLWKDSSCHVHTDLATKAYFEKKKTPNIKEGYAEFQERLSPFDGATMNAKVMATFEVAAADLPPLLRLYKQTPVKSEGVSLELTGGTLAVKGSPLTQISWETDDAGKQSRITIEMRTSYMMSGDYLVANYEQLKGFYNAFFKTSE